MTARSLSLDSLDKPDPLEEDSEDPLAFFLKQGKNAAALQAQVTSSEGIPLPVVGECAASSRTITWYRGPLKDFEKRRKEISVDVVAQLAQEQQSVDPALSFLCFFLRIGATTFRLLSPIDERSSDHSRSRDSEENDGAPAAATTTGIGKSSSAEDVATTPFRRVKDRYSQAVAFEFVTNLMDSVTLTEGDEE